MAPPAQLPNATVVTYVGSHAGDTASGWGFTVTHSGDGHHDTTATLTDDYFGPVLTTRTAAPTIYVLVRQGTTLRRLG